jgi:hypothetical protein
MRHISTPRTKKRNRCIALLLLCGAVGSGLYLVHLGNTDSWPETGCAVVGNRIVRNDVADSHRAIVMYRGEYRLRYTVSGQEYYVWANSGWADVDRQFIQDKVDYLPDTCDFRIRYNPRRPSEAIAVRK